MRVVARLKQYLTGSHPIDSHPAEPPAPTTSPLRISETFFRSYPTPQNALDIFQGEWVCQLPSPDLELRAGTNPLFADERLKWFLEEIGGVRDKAVLELGPLEGGHSYMLDRAGARHVISIEANARAFLKCLIVKELLGLPSVHFLCGDFVVYLRQTATRFEVCVASGVLYHQQNPPQLIALLAEHCTGSLYMWTHYYDQALVAANANIAANFPRSHSETYLGFQHTLYDYDYPTGPGQPTFLGGTEPASCWMTKADILRCLENFGFDAFRIRWDHPDHPSGPAFALVADRRRTRQAA